MDLMPSDFTPVNSTLPAALFFQFPKRFWKGPQESVRFENRCLGVNKLGNMKELGKAANLSQVYTNHCIRATAITLWSDAGLSNCHIMTLSGHRNENSLKSYNARPRRSSSRCAVTFSHLPWIQKPHKLISKRKSSEGTNSNFNNQDPLLVLWFLTSKTSQGKMSDSTSQPSSRAAKSGKFTLRSRAIKHSDIHLEVLSLQNRKFF